MLGSLYLLCDFMVVTDADRESTNRLGIQMVIEWMVL